VRSSVSLPLDRGNEGARQKGDHMYIGGGFIALILIILLLIWLF
jgi:flagellar biogenesis protein FliO